MLTLALSRKAAAVVVGLVLCLHVGEAGAGSITAISAPAGPGGSGVAWSLSSGSGNNEDRVPPTTNSNIATNSGISFSSVDVIDSEFTVAPSGGIHEYMLLQLAVVNGTGVDWVGFILNLLPRESNDLTFDTPFGGAAGERTPTPVFSIPGDSFSVGPALHVEDVIFFDLAAHPFRAGEGSQVSLSIDVPDGIESFTLRFVPVPEPAAAALLLLGLAALGSARRLRLAGFP